MFEGNTRVQKYVSQHGVKARSVGHQTSATEVHGGSLQPWREIMMRNTQTWKLGSLDNRFTGKCAFGDSTLNDNELVMSRK